MLKKADKVYRLSAAYNVRSKTERNDSRALTHSCRVRGFESGRRWAWVSGVPPPWCQAEAWAYLTQHIHWPTASS